MWLICIMDAWEHLADFPKLVGRLITAGCETESDGITVILAYLAD